MTSTYAPAGTPTTRSSRLDRLLRPRSIAVVGASASPGKLGSVMLEAVNRGSDGSVAVFGINPKGEGDGFQVSLQAATEAHGAPIDLAVLCIPAAATPDALREAAEGGVGAALICSGGFAEAGPDGLALQTQLAEIASSTGIRVLGPNTSGFFRPASNTVSFVSTVEHIAAGTVAVVAASGGMNHALSFLLSEHGVGVGLGVGLGNSVDVTNVDVLECLRHDPSITAIALHVESVDDGQALLAAVRAVTTDKPIVAIVVGRSDVSAFSESHTGALATSWKTTRALLTEAGAVVVDSEQQLVDALAVLSRTRLPASAAPGIGLVTAQAGPGLMILDELLAQNVQVPTLTERTQAQLSDLLPPMTFQANPVDTGRPGATFGAILTTTAADTGIDALAVYALAEPDAIDLADAVRHAGVHTEMPVVLGIGGPAEAVAKTSAAAADIGVPVLPSPTALATGIRALVHDARLRFLRTADTDSPSDARPAAPAITLPADEAAAKDLLDALAITTPRRRVCADHDSAHQALRELSLPVAVKILDAGVLHKTELGGVHLGIRTPHELDAALDALDAIDAPAYLVETMADPGVDLFLGARRDPVFGPIIVAGLGGTAAEAIGDVTIRSHNVTSAGAAAMLDDLLCAPLLAGWRGGPVLDRDEFARVAITLASYLTEHSEIGDIEINPLRLTPTGLTALDAVIVAAPHRQTALEGELQMNTRTPVSIEGVVPWPDEFAERYRKAGYWEGTSLGSHIARQVERRPDEDALVDGPNRLTYRGLWEKSASCAQHLLDLSIAPGDRIVLQLPNCWEFVALTLACFRIGVIPVMALPAHRRHELTHLASLSEATAIIVADSDRDTDLREVAQRVAAEVPSVRTVLVHGALSSGDTPHAPELSLAAGMETTPRFVDADYEPTGADVACLLLSGGTTGLPKLIVRTHDDYVYNIVRCNAVTEFDSETVYLGTLPSSHNFSLACPGILGALFTGGRTVMLPSPAPERALRAIDTEGVTVAAVVPAVAQAWIEHQREHHTLTGATLRVLQVGGSRMPDELAARVEPVLGARLQQVFGMAEGLINMTRLDDDPDVITNTQGRPVSEADEIAVVDEKGAPVPDGTPGALLTRGPYTPRGYFRAAEHNARAFTPDGWYASGDIVVSRPDGNLVVAGRDKDMINRGGEKVSAEEVENFAYQIDGVEMAAAVAMPDPVLGERPCLYVSLAAGRQVTLDDVVAVMNDAGVARFKFPERLVVVDALPTTKVGKIDKKAIREDIRERLANEREPLAP